MQPPIHSLPALFKQLGLPNEPRDIEAFVSSHGPLKAEIALADAFLDPGPGGLSARKDSGRCRLGRDRRPAQPDAASLTLQH